MPKTAPFETHVHRYEAWFEKYPYVYAAELKAARALVPQGGFGVEVGVGTGRFAAPLQIHSGVEPSVQMAKIANFSFKQTIFESLSEVTPAEPVKAGYGQGAFVVVRAFRY